MISSAHNRNKKGTSAHDSQGGLANKGVSSLGPLDARVDQHMPIKHASSGNQGTKERDGDSNVNQEGDISDEHAEFEEKANVQIAIEVNNKIHVLGENVEADAQYKLDHEDVESTKYNGTEDYFPFSRLRGTKDVQAQEMVIVVVPYILGSKMRTKMIMLLIIHALLDPYMEDKQGCLPPRHWCQIC